ncbi:hypothetical protein RJ639_005918 [Escallonia herrerae]|uniref:Integrase catalytic domain-containing protein n=1 Tax=Escallonia herrerae TaxID=1293975 RepID=A0AA89AVA5_9ASTE|nr:hypothetical protein RJ639_005918 [Escallonia herrerae]
MSPQRFGPVSSGAFLFRNLLKAIFILRSSVHDPYFVPVLSAFLLGNVSRIYDVCRAFYRPEKETKTLTAFFMDFKKTYEELNVLLPYSSDIKVQQAQREQMAVVSFLGALPPEFDTAKSQILSGTAITSLQEVFSRVLRTESTFSNQQSSVLVANRGGWSNNRGDRGGGGRGGHNEGTSEIVCYYYKKPRHTKRYCKKLQNRNQRVQTSTAIVAATSSLSSEKTVTISVDEYTKLAQRQKSVAAFAELGKKCLISSSNKWVIDSGATYHMTSNLKIFSSFRSHTAPSPVTITDGSNYTIKGSGTVKPTSSITLPFVLSLPSLAFNLMSVSRLTKDLNCCISFFPDHCLFQDLMTKQTIGRRHVSDGLYILDAWVPRSVACSGVVSPFEAHCQLSHPSLPMLKKLCPQFHDVSSVDCESCHFAEHHRSSLSPRVNKRAEFAFELVHSDVWGPCPILFKTGFRYFVTFVDDFPRMTWIYFMKNRSEVFTHFSAFCAVIKTQFDVHVHILRSDNAKEYMLGSFQNYMNQHGILHQSSCANTPAQNGVAERKNRHLLETARALLFQMKVPKPFWADAISTACFLINRMPSTVLNGDVPYSVLFPTKTLFPVEPRIFGSTCFVRDVRPHLTKLDPKALKCVFLGYSLLQKGYQCYSPDLHRYLVSIDVVFSEHSPFFSSKSDSSIKPSNAIDGTSSGVAQSEDVDCLGEQPIVTSAPVKPPIVQVNSRRQEHHDTCPEPAYSSSDPPPTDLDLPIDLRKVFYRKSAAGVILLVYVDDIVITGEDCTGITSLKKFLHTKFHTKDLGQLKYFLEIEVTRSKKGIFLSQRKYVLDMIAETRTAGAKPCNTPMNPSVHLTKDDGDRFNDPKKYRRLVGKLNYLTVTRPNIAYAVSTVSQFMSEPTVKH